MYYKQNTLVRQQGFSLASAIFILVIMALLAAAVVSLFDKGNKGITQEVLSTRAFFAAESGAQFMLGQLFSLSGGAANCSASNNLSYNATGFAGCSSNMSCSSRNINGETYYTINSTGTCAAGPDRAVRQVELQARTP